MICVLISAAPVLKSRKDLTSQVLHELAVLVAVADHDVVLFRLRRAGARHHWRLALEGLGRLTDVQRLRLPPISRGGARSCTDVISGKKEFLANRSSQASKGALKGKIQVEEQK